MKIVAGAFFGLLLAGVASVPAAQAQGVPQGSYLRSCTDVSVRGDTLVARCRRSDGREQTASLAAVNRCVGDIGNNNGNLQCNYGAGGAPRAQAPQGQGYGQGYGREGYGSDRGGYDRRERCEGLRRESEELRSRLDREWNPYERSRTEGRLREVREQEQRCYR